MTFVNICDYQNYHYIAMYFTKIILKLGTDMSEHEQRVQIQIRLSLKEQSDQGLHCLPVHLHLLHTIPHSKTKVLNFNPIAFRKAKIVYNFGLSECNRVKYS